MEENLDPCHLLFHGQNPGIGPCSLTPEIWAPKFLNFQIGLQCCQNGCQVNINDKLQKNVNCNPVICNFRGLEGRGLARNAPKILK